ncbi:MAG TPA: TIM-barrel domain-containing protein [Cyclobacteriaceae bacterium]|nr:TIM-barrel domain-containing protein [Cyclobacteriaceae bacterium]
MKNLFLLLTALTVLSCQQKPTYRKTSDGVIIKLSGNVVDHIKLRVIDENIIQVLASPDSANTDNSMMVVPQAITPAAWDLAEIQDGFELKTSNVTVTISNGGLLTFKDAASGAVLLKETIGGRSLEPYQLEGTTSYHIRQVFESPDDEAFYGLGGHQNGQMNYKGEDVELAQHNIVDVVPFLYSSKNYGLLWDNYSISKFGDPRDYQPLSSLQLFTRDGRAGGLTADYYVEDKVVKSLVQNDIGIEYLETPAYDTFPQDVSRKGKVIWEGSFSSEVEGDHKFLVYSSNYFKVWVDGNLLLDKWRQNWNPWTNKFSVALKKGEKHNLKVEWLPDGGYMAVKHLDPLPPQEQSNLSLWSEAGDNINYYFVRGSNADEVIAGYRKLTGKAPIPPKWAMGYWQSRERYRNQNELVEVVKEYRKRQIPLDNIVLDWQYWKDPDWGTHTFDASRFPDPKGMVNQIHDLHANIMISVWPKFNKGTASYDEMNDKGFLFKRNIEKGRKDWVGVGYQNTFYDPFNPEAGKLFWQRIDERLNSIGMDAWWLDATEPDMHSNLSIEERKLNMTPTAIGPGAKYFNAYSLANSKNLYEGQRASSPEKRVFILTRSAYAGQQRYGAVTWSGDIVSRWSDFKDQIATGINFSLSGIPYWTMDIGGFAVERRYEKATGETLDEWRELNTRWFQYGAFCPVFRSHGQYPFREIYNIAEAGSEHYNSMVYYDKMRYRLMPYIYTLAGKAYFDDYTIMRGLVMDFNDDPKVRDIGDQYMFGPSLMVCPLYEYKARKREVYLPAGAGWYDMESSKYYEGGQTITVDAPLDRIPVFVREGSVVPTGPDMQYTTEKTDPLTIQIYAGKDGNFNLYEDESVNYNYENNSFSIIPLNTLNDGTTLHIDHRFGEFEGMKKERTIIIIWISKDGATKTSKPFVYTGEEATYSATQ